MLNVCFGKDSAPRKSLLLDGKMNSDVSLSTGLSAREKAGDHTSAKVTKKVAKKAAKKVAKKAAKKVTKKAAKKVTKKAAKKKVARKKR
jgi:phage-related tail fiber protein